MKSECIISNLSLKVRCDTGHSCQCTVFLKAVHSFDSDMSSSFADSRGVPYGYGGKSIPVGSIRKYFFVLLVKLILHTLSQEGRCNF